MAAGRGALVVNRVAGHVPTLALPIPDCSLVSLSILMRAETREWISVGERSELSICGHEFRIVDWREHGLVIEHRCCGVL